MREGKLIAWEGNSKAELIARPKIKYCPVSVFCVSTPVPLKSGPKRGFLAFVRDPMTPINFVRKDLCDISVKPT